MLFVASMKGVWPAGLVMLIGCGVEFVEPTDADDLRSGCDRCSGDTICVEGACEAAFPRLYTLRIDAAAFPTRKIDGTCWDEPGCGAPDPEVAVRLNGQELAMLELDADRFEMAVEQAVDFELVAGSKIEIELFDKDLTENEPALSCRFEPITGAELRVGNLGCSAEGAAVTAQIHRQ